MRLDKVKNVVFSFLVYGLLISKPSFSKEKPLELTPAQAVSIFIHNNYNVLIDKYNIDKAYANYLESKAHTNPSIYMSSVQHEIRNGELRSRDSTSNIGIAKLFRMGGKRRLNMKLNYALYKSSIFTHDDNVRNLLIGFMSLYYQVIIDKIALRQAKDDLDNYEKVLKIAKYQRDYGFISSLDYFKLSVYKVNLQSAVYQAQSQYQNDLKQLKTLMRIKKPIRLKAGYTVAFLLNQKPNLKKYEELALNRFDIKAARYQLQSDIYNLKFQKAQNVPDLTFNFEIDTVGIDSAGRRYPFMIGAGLTFPLPIFDRNVGGILNAAYSIKQDKLMLKNLEDTAKTQTYQAYQNFLSAQKTFRAYVEKKKEIEKILDISQKSFALRGISVLDLLDAERTYKDFMASYRNALYQLMLSRTLLDLYSRGSL
jgi:Outer membrane protein